MLHVDMLMLGQPQQYILTSTLPLPIGAIGCSCNLPCGSKTLLKASMYVAALLRHVIVLFVLTCCVPAVHPAAAACNTGASDLDRMVD